MALKPETMKNNLKGLNYDPNQKPPRRVPVVQIALCVLLIAAVIAVIKIWGGF